MAPLAQPRPGRDQRIVPRPPPRTKPQHDVLRQHSIRVRKRHARNRPAVRARRCRPQRIVRTELPPDVGKNGAGQSPRRRPPALELHRHVRQARRLHRPQTARSDRPRHRRTLAHNTRPCIADGFDEGPTNTQSRELMSKLLSWHATHQNLSQGEPYSAVATIISTESRNIRHSPLIPPHLPILQAVGVSVVGLRDEELAPEKLRPFSVITIETADCLPPSAAKALSGWVRGGGTLVAAPDTGSYDEIGRRRAAGTLWKSLELDAPPTQDRPIGRGHVVAPTGKEFAM